MHSNILWHHAPVTRKRRELQNGHKSFILWFTGLSGAGKSTLAHCVEEALFVRGCRTYVFDGDNVRHAPLSVCEQRDVKGLHMKARRGEISDFTGISSPYEIPDKAEIVVMTGEQGVEECAGQIIEYLERSGKISPNHPERRN